MRATRAIKYITIILLASIHGTVLSQESNQSSSSASKEAVAISTSGAKRLVELDTGVEFALPVVWKKLAGEEVKYGMDSTEGPITVAVRFPVHFKKPAATAEELRERDLKQWQEMSEWKKEHRKIIEASWELPQLPDNISIISNGVEGNRGKGTFLIRNFYLTSPLSGIIAINCESPLSTATNDDACMSFVYSAKLIPADERQRRLAARKMIDRLYDDSKKEDVPCSTVNDENKEFRTFYPNAKLEDIPRFKTLNTYMLALYFSKMGQVKADKLKEYLALIKETPALLKQLEDYCVINPGETYAAAAKVVFRTSKSESK